MTLTIDFSPTEEEQIVAVARQEGLEPAAFVKKLVNARLPSTESRSEDSVLALFLQWEQEDAQMTSEEVVSENRGWEQFKTDINAERDRAGARRVF